MIPDKRTAPSVINNRIDELISEYPVASIQKAAIPTIIMMGIINVILLAFNSKLPFSFCSRIYYTETLKREARIIHDLKRKLNVMCKVLL